ncbi:FeoB-associated Cys-rich membrane protein [Actinobacillus succinogenes]|uniref:Virus attachment protein p12 family n=1 Tax=Actinobacillus succinogenes (strain ATCC 55618 / DSM 22257 / CCUG 43843 / 130Z) TaxID=339671 RepID=A6VN34_ACTSZ|nr:FeoB-associated Cys-rich membrane protein [Actinobacillus succinogenes]ABR74381.1 conserved hypothetical protein [Actinobacillus succinogenes 130Z]PHI39197.1 FeoB-associated Cys-rich membrane protein [Actinobacillus succinogenes]
MGQYIVVGIIVGLCILYVLRKFVFKSEAAKNKLCCGCDRCDGKNGSC